MDRSLHRRVHGRKLGGSDGAEKTTRALACCRFVTLFRAFLEPGQRVRHPTHPDWGVGQVQSAIAERVTVNFPNAGKVLINAREVELQIVDEPPGRPARA